MPRPRALALPLLAALALLAGACGSSPSFKSSFAADRAQFRKVGDALGTELQAAVRQSDSQVAAAFRSLADRLSAVENHLAALHPPGRYKGETGRLVLAFRSVVAQLRAIERDAETHNAKAASSDTLVLVQRAGAVKALDTEISTQLGLPAPTG